MNQKISRRGFLGVTAGGVAALAAACGGSSGGGSTGASANGKTRLVWWDYYTQGGSANAVAWAHQEYMRQFPKVTIERRVITFADMKRTLLQGASAGELPDIIAIDNSDVQSFAALGILADVTDRMQAWSGSANILPSALDTLTWKGKRYGVPDSVNCLSLFYNKGMLKDAGVDVPTTWDELQTAAAKLTKGNRFGMAVSAIQTEEATFQFLPWLWQAGADIPTLNSSGGQAALNYWKTLIDQGHMSRGVLGWTQRDVETQFVQKQTAMMVNGPFQLPALKTAPADVTWSVALLPKGQKAASVIGSEDLCITAQSKNKDAAWQLLTWLKKPENALARLKLNGKLPDDKTLYSDPYFVKDPIKSVFIRQLDVAHARAYGPHYPQISEDIQKAIQAVLTGSKPPSQALAAAAEDIGTLLQKS